MAWRWTALSDGERGANSLDGRNHDLQGSRRYGNPRHHRGCGRVRITAISGVSTPCRRTVSNTTSNVRERKPEQGTSADGRKPVKKRPKYRSPAPRASKAGGFEWSSPIRPNLTSSPSICGARGRTPGCLAVSRLWPAARFAICPTVRTTPSCTSPEGGCSSSGTTATTRTASLSRRCPFLDRCALFAVRSRLQGNPPAAVPGRPLYDHIRDCFGHLPNRRL